MPLPFAFASVSNATGQNLDDDFNALGAITPIPVSVSGTNSLQLTPLINTPTISTYVTYQPFVGQVAGTNTAPVNAAVGSLPFKPVFKDSPSGPVLLTGGEMVASNMFSLLYDPELDSLQGGFHLIIGQFLVGNYLLLSGGTLTGLLTAPNITVTTLTTTGQLKVAAGQTLVRMVSALVATQANIPANSTVDQAVTLPGVAIGDAVIINPPTLPAGVMVNASANGSNSVVIRWANVLGSQVNTATGNYRLTALGFA